MITKYGTADREVAKTAEGHQDVQESKSAARDKAYEEHRRRVAQTETDRIVKKDK
jgi:hypothetical protein